MALNNALSLSELNKLIKIAFQECFPDRYWVRVEVSEMRTTGVGHCYLEFIEKETRTGAIVAKIRGNIWANTYKMLKPYFEEETGQYFASGIKILIQVTIDFHEVYGPSLTVVDIDPSFTLGDMLRRRGEIVRQLKEEGVFEQNKTLVLNPLPRRLAIISSATAAGYDDFMNQLQMNGSFAFSTTLFASMMQGDQVENSMLKALQAIERQRDKFDAVVIIRGGGAVSDLSCFDSYLLAKRCALFPLPIITGIGHERDESILDMVAHTRTKTPTAAAEFLIQCFVQQIARVTEIEYKIIQTVRFRLEADKTFIQAVSTQLSRLTRTVISKEQLRLNNCKHHLGSALLELITDSKMTLRDKERTILYLVRTKLNAEHSKIKLFEQALKFSSPEILLRKGYTLTTKGGKTVRSFKELNRGDRVVTHFADGATESTVD